MASVDQISQILRRRWLVLDEDKKKVQSQSGNEFLVSSLVYSTEIRNALYKKVNSIMIVYYITLTVIGENRINK